MYKTLKQFFYLFNNFFKVKKWFFFILILETKNSSIRLLEGDDDCRKYFSIDWFFRTFRKYILRFGAINIRGSQESRISYWDGMFYRMANYLPIYVVFERKTFIFYFIERKYITLVTFNSRSVPNIYRIYYSR